MAMWGDGSGSAGLYQLYKLEACPRCGITHPRATHTAGTDRKRTVRYTCICFTLFKFCSTVIAIKITTDVQGL